jgi:hypothetical protein
VFSDVYCSEVHCVLCPATPTIALPTTFSIAAILLLLVQAVVYLVHVHVGCSHPALWSAACTSASHLGCCPFTTATACHGLQLPSLLLWRKQAFIYLWMYPLAAHTLPSF